MRDARAEASARLDDRYDVRVLEPSPPTDTTPPFFADDPVAGGEVVPLVREGARSWDEVCAERGDDELRRWCEERWLVRRPLAPLPEAFVTTRVSLHAVAEHVLAPCRARANGKIGLRFTYHGFGTPFFGDDRQVRVEDGVLVDGDRRCEAATTLAAAAAFVGLEGSELAREPVTVDPVAARALGDWYGFCTSLLEQLRGEAGDDDTPGRVQLWPEHFDIAVDLGPESERANYGGSPGDAEHAEPYLYVGPWEPQEGEFWNEPFGASLSYSAILAGTDPLAFLRDGRSLLRGRPTLGDRGRRRRAGDPAAGR